jgi:hypothetical protein
MKEGLQENRDIFQIIPQVMQEAYAYVAKHYAQDLVDKRPEAVYMEGSMCQQTSEGARDALMRRRIPAQYVYINNPKMFLEYGGKHHVYLLVDGQYLLDGTWHSFLENIRKDNPYLFININNLEAGLKAANVPKEFWPIWLEYKKYYEIALKSANETKYWLTLLMDSGLADQNKTEILLTEARELANMLATGVMRLKGKI